MKKFLLAIVIAISLTSCYEEIEFYNKEESAKYTTIYSRELPKDTVTVSVDEKYFYVFDKNKNVTLKSRGVDTFKTFWLGALVGALMFGIITLIVELRR